MPGHDNTKRSPIPQTRKDDHEDVAWALSTAEASFQRGDRAEALKWVRRAAESASDVGADRRALELAKAGSELATAIAGNAAAPLPAQAATTPSQKPPPLPSQRPPPLPPQKTAGSLSAPPPRPLPSPSQRPPAPSPSQRPLPPAPSSGRGLVPLPASTTSRSLGSPSSAPRVGVPLDRESAGTPATLRSDRPPAMTGAPPAPSGAPLIAVPPAPLIPPVPMPRPTLKGVTDAPVEARRGGRRSSPNIDTGAVRSAKDSRRSRPDDAPAPKTHEHRRRTRKSIPDDGPNAHKPPSDTVIVAAKPIPLAAALAPAVSQAPVATEVPSTFEEAATTNAPGQAVADGDADLWPTDSLSGDELSEMSHEKTRLDGRAYSERSRVTLVSGEPAPATASQAVRVVLYRGPDGLRVVPYGTKVASISAEAILVALDPAVDLVGWFSK